MVGLLERKGQSPMGSDYDDAAFIPVTTFQNQIQGGLQKYIAGIIAVSAIVGRGHDARAERDHRRSCATATTSAPPTRTTSTSAT